MPEDGWCEDAPGPAYAGSDSRSGNHCGTRENSASPSPPSTAPQQGWEDPGVPKAGTVQRAVAKEQGRTALLPLCSHTCLQSQCDPPHPQILLAPCPDPPPPYTALNCGQVSLQERWHHLSTYFTRKILPLFWDGEEKEAPYTLLPRNTGKHQIPTQTSMFRCVFPGRFDTQHSKVWGSNIYVDES